MKSFLHARIIEKARDGGTWTAIGSAPTEDRDGEVVDAFAFANHPKGLPESIPVHDGHRFEGSKTLVGRARPHYDRNGVLLLEGAFAPTDAGQEVRGLVRDGFLDSMSVVFIDPERYTKDGTPHIKAAELLACDFVSIPSNRDARVLTVRSYGPDEFRRYISSVLADAERTLVDLAVADAKALLAETAEPRFVRGKSARAQVDAFLRDRGVL